MSEINKIIATLSPGRRFVLETPATLTQAERDKIMAFLNLVPIDRLEAESE